MQDFSFLPSLPDHVRKTPVDNFWAVFAAGLTIIGLEGYYNWVRCTNLIREEREIIRKLDEDKKRSGIC